MKAINLLGMATENTTTIGEKIAEDGKSVAFQLSVNLKRLRPYICPITDFNNE